MSGYEMLLTHGAIYQLADGGTRYLARRLGSDGVFTVWLLIPTNDDGQAFDAPWLGLWVTPMGNLGLAYMVNWPLDPPKLTCHLMHTYADGGRPMHLGDLLISAEPPASNDTNPYLVHLRKLPDVDLDMDVWGEVLR